MTASRSPRRLAFSAGLLAAGLGVGAAAVGADPAAATAPAGAPVRPATRPASGPSTGPATRPGYSLATPRDALKWFAAALRDGDAARLRQVVLTANDAEGRMVDAMGEMARALSGLHAAAARAFGPEAAGRFTDDTAAGFEQAVARIDAADVTVDGDEAIVRYPESAESPYTLKLGPAGWKLPATHFSQGATPEVLDRRMGELRVQTKIVTELAADIAGGRFKTADAAGQAWRSRMMAAVGGPAPRPGVEKQASTVPGTTKPGG